MNKIRALIVYAFLTLMFCTYAVADSRKLSIKIEDAESKKPLSDTSCRVYSPKGKLYRFAISNNEGLITISSNAGDILEFSHIGYRKVRYSSSKLSNNRTNKIRLNKEEVHLREVIVKARPIVAKSDTIVYYVSSFKKIGDTHLKDVLKQLPGIKVAENGAVSYQGKSINKFYIEGRDLLGNRYNQATNNMPINAVSRVEVMENHQPIKMLKDNQFSDKAALNIRLKKGFVARPFGEIASSAGYGDNTLYKGKIFLTQIFSKDQMMITGKINNSGEDLSNETKEHIDISNLEAFERIDIPIINTSLSDEIIKKSYYLDNRSISSGANYLHAINNDSEIRTNFILYNDRTRHLNLHNFTYGGTQKVNIVEKNNNYQKSFTIVPILKYEKNSETFYLSNESRFCIDKQDLLSKTITNNRTHNTNTSQKPEYLQNFLNTSFYLGEQIIKLKSFVRYFDRRESLDSYIANNSLWKLNEAFETKSITVKNYASTNMNIGKNTLELLARLYYKKNDYTHSGKVSTSTLTASFSPTYSQYLGRDRHITLGLPLKLLRTKLDVPTLRNTERNKVCLSPNVYLKYDINHHWGVRLSGSIDLYNDTPGMYSSKDWYSSYRTLNKTNTDIFFSKSEYISGKILYKDLVNMLFFNISIGHNRTKKEYITNFDYQPKITTVEVINKKNNRDMLIISSNIDKSFTDIGLSVKTSIDYNQTSCLFSQSGVLLDNKSNILVGGISTLFQELNWMKILASLKATMFWQSNSEDIRNKRKLYNVNVSTFIHPTKGMDAKVEYGFYKNEVGKGKYKNFGILNGNVKYQLSKRLEINGYINNILDVKDYSITSDEGINTYYYKVPLRGREYLVGLLWRL